MNRPQLSRKEIMLIIAGSMLTLLLAALDNTIVSTAMPKIIRDLDGMEHYAWPFTSYMLFSTVVLPISGKLADIYGRKKITLIGIAAFSLTSILCGFSSNMIELSIFRGFQGIGGGICISSAFIIVSELFPMGKRIKYISMITSMFALASILGPVAGGTITDYLSWRWVFFINIPLSALAFFLIAANLPVIIHHEEKRRIDLLGVVFFVLGSFSLLFVINQLGSRSFFSVDLIGLTSFALIMLVMFIRTEKRSREPLLSLHFFKERIFSVSVVASSLGNMAIFGAAIYFPLYLQSVRGMSATGSGLVIMPMMVAMIAASNISGFMISRLKMFKPVAVTGLSIACIGMLCFGLLGHRSPISLLIIFSTFTGAGIGMTFPIFSVAPQSVFPHRQVGIVASLLQFFRSLGGSVGSAIFGTVMLVNMNDRLKNTTHGNLSDNIAELVKNPGIISNPHKLEAIRSSLPGSSMTDFDNFVRSCLFSISGSIELIFVVASVFLMLSVVCVLKYFNERHVLRSISEYKMQSSDHI